MQLQKIKKFFWTELGLPEDGSKRARRHVTPVYGDNGLPVTVVRVAQEMM